MSSEEKVIMPKSHWVAALNAVRAKGGTTDAILSGDLARKIKALPEGGVVYEEFVSVSSDGTELTEPIEVNNKVYETWIFTLDDGSEVTKTLDAAAVETDFSETVSFSIPEGAVAAITRDDGTVIWERPVVFTAEFTEFNGYSYGWTPVIAWAAQTNATGYAVRTLGLSYYTAEASKVAPDWTETVVWENEKREDMSYSGPSTAPSANNVIYYRAVVALYKNADDDIDDYVKKVEIISPRYVCSGDDAYTLAPYMLDCTVENGIATINWGVLSAAVYIAGFEIQYSYNERNVWYAVATLTDTSLRSYQYDISGQTRTSVSFRIRAYSTRSKYETTNYDYCHEWISLT